MGPVFLTDALAAAGALASRGDAAWMGEAGRGAEEPWSERPPMYKSQHASQLPPTATTFPTGGTTCPAVANVGGYLEQKPVADKSHSTFGKPKGVVGRCGEAHGTQL
eukprot:g11417.t1